eukprot:TRINITY_DN52159_c0_g1_i1.p1 TRINITY_DN52159_c0_g1~~TRINITY_DN52159_c0_g1_i1.p1  ORF type:complete len:153 (+),score=15.08 TRINITY_DN52159_c0_g1_i1:91-549(+)
MCIRDSTGIAGPSNSLCTHPVKADSASSAARRSSLQSAFSLECSPTSTPGRLGDASCRERTLLAHSSNLSHKLASDDTTIAAALVVVGDEMVVVPSMSLRAVSYTHLRAHETPEHLVCRLLLEKKKKTLTQALIQDKSCTKASVTEKMNNEY